jgi:precorrin-3B C17-methyltransferase
MSETKGIVYAIGIGNSPGQITAQARDALATVDVVAGHYGFVEMARPHINPRAKVIDDREARRRARTFEFYQQNRVSAVVAEALKGQSVAVLSGGDAGIWGMAGVLLEAQEVWRHAFDVRVIPGVPSMVTIAAKLGAPLQNGFTVISVADEDTPFAVIEQRLRGAALGGGVIVLYKLILENLYYPEYYPPDKYPELFPPAEKTRHRWERTCAILSERIPPERPMAIVTDACDQTSHYSAATEMLGSDDHKESIVIAPFREFLERSGTYRFFTTVIIGDATTRRFGDVLITPQWNYKWTYAKEMMNDVVGLPYLKEQEEFFASVGRPLA